MFIQPACRNTMPTKPTKLLFIFGTRPEAIKLAPLIREFEKKKDAFEVKCCVTAQHREMLDQVLHFFDIRPAYDLNIMQPDQSLFDVSASVLKALEKILKDYDPQLVIVQGDTTTAFIASLAAYYRKIKIAHVEAGLRSDDKYAPFPEEVNRLLADHLADYHFAPTASAVSNLKREHITKHVYNVGNTVIDALHLGLRLLKDGDESVYVKHFSMLKQSQKIVLITGHRRENFGTPFENICYAIKELAGKYSDTAFVYPVHLNPHVREPVNKILSGLSNVHLVEPLSYPHFIWLMNKCSLVLTDSGGLQEEAPSLGKPVLVMREVTERPEGIAAGTARLVGTSKESIVNSVSELLSNENKRQEMIKAVNPYGDGSSSAQIVAVIENEINEKLKTKN